MFMPLPGIVPPNPLPYILCWQYEYMLKSEWWKSLTWFCSHERIREQRLTTINIALMFQLNNFNFMSPLTKIRLFLFAFFFRSLHTLTQCYVFVTYLFAYNLSSEKVGTSSKYDPFLSFEPCSATCEHYFSIDKRHKHYHHLKTRYISMKWSLFWLQSTCLKRIYPDMEIKLLILKKAVQDTCTRELHGCRF